MDEFSDEYHYRDSKCEEIEVILGEYPQFEGWIARRIRIDLHSSTSDKYEILDRKGRHISDFYEHELNLLIESDFFLYGLDMARQTRFFRSMGLRGCLVSTVTLAAISIFIILQFTNLIFSLPKEQAIAAFFGIFVVGSGIFCLMALIERKSKRIDFTRELRDTPHRETEGDVLPSLLDQYDELKELRETDPDEYLRRIKKHIGHIDEGIDEI